MADSSIEGVANLDTKSLIGFGAVALVGYFALPKILGMFGQTSPDISKASEMTISTNGTPGTFSPTSAAIVDNAYLSVPLANDALMESYAMQGSRNPNGWTAQSLLGNKYVDAMQSSGMLDSYQGIYGVVGS